MFLSCITFTCNSENGQFFFEEIRHETGWSPLIDLPTLNHEAKKLIFKGQSAHPQQCLLCLFVTVFVTLFFSQQRLQGEPLQIGPEANSENYTGLEYTVTSLLCQGAICLL